MRQQFNQVLSRLPSRNATDDIPEIRLPEFGEIDLDKGNTTSVTKVKQIHNTAFKCSCKTNYLRTSFFPCIALNFIYSCFKYRTSRYREYCLHRAFYI